MTSWNAILRPVALSVLALGPLATKLAAAEASPTLSAAVDSAFRPLLTAYDVPGIAVAVTAQGHRFFFNYGVAERATDAPVSENTIFEIGSLSKTFTATLAAYAVAEGRMSLAQHPDAFLPALRGSPIAEASLRELGTFMAGGLPLQVPDAVRNHAELIAYLQRWTPEAPTGRSRRYSNVSIGLFGYVASLAMKRDFAASMEGTIIPKLGLRSTFIHVPGARMSAYAWGYDKAGSPVRVSPGEFDAEAYGIKSTAADMIRFVDLNIRPDDLAAPLRQAVEGTHVGYARVGEMTQGLGWEGYAYPVSLDRLLAGNSSSMILDAQAAEPLSAPHIPTEPTLFDKTGSTNGFGAYAAFVPAKRIGIVMLANKNLPIPARIKAASAVLQRLAADPIE